MAHRAQLIAATAVKSFSPTRGANLHTHVYRQLQQLQRIAPQITDPLSPSEQLRRDRGAVLKAMNQVQNNLGREASDEEVSEIAKLPVKRITKVRGLLNAGLPASVIEESGDDDEDTPDVVVNQTTPRDDWHGAVYHDLGDLDRLVMQYRTGYRDNPVLSTNEIAKRVNLTPSAVSQRARRIQAKLDEFNG